MRPVVTPGGRSLPEPRTERPAARARAGATARAQRGADGRSGVRVTRLAREADDGFQSRLVPGLRSAAAARRLAEELAFAAARLAALATDPPGLYAEVADPAGDVEQRTWLAFEIALIGPRDGEDPFAAIRAWRASWGAAQSADGTGAIAPEPGPRSAYDPARPTRTIDAYRAWAARAGSQAAGLTGEPSWTPERRFARAFERLALPGLDRGPRFDLLVTLGRLGVYQLRADALHLGGSDVVTLGAKRILGIGEPMLLERRAAALADACGLPLEALDVAFFNWERRERATLGMGPSPAVDAVALAAAEDALGL